MGRVSKDAFQGFEFSDSMEAEADSLYGNRVPVERVEIKIQYCIFIRPESGR